jgi:sec-independent protein translocase protein TatA
MLLFLNDIAGSEVLVILVVVLMFFGSKSIPSIAQTLGRTIRQIKDASNDLQSEIKKSGMDIKKDLNLEGLIQDTAREVQQPLDQSVSELNEAVAYTPPSTEAPKIEPPVTELPAENPTETPLTEKKETQS